MTVRNGEFLEPKYDNVLNIKLTWVSQFETYKQTGPIYGDINKNPGEITLQAENKKWLVLQEPCQDQL